MNIKKLAIGFGIFMAYYLAARIIENKVAVVSSIANFGAKSDS